MPLFENLSWEVSIIGLSLTLFTLADIATKSYKHKTDFLLCIWLLLLNIPLLHTFLLHLELSVPAFIQYTNPTLNLLNGPILYLYVRLLVSDERVIFKKKHLLHIVPFAFFYLLFISVAHPKVMLPSPQGADPGPIADSGFATLFEPLMPYFGLINGLFFIGYSVATIRMLNKHQEVITSIFSQNDNQINLRWIYALPITFTILVSLNFINEYIMGETAQVYPLTLHMLSFLCFITLLCFFGVKQKPVFHFRQTQIKVEDSIKEEISDPEMQNNKENFENKTCSELSDDAMHEIIEQMQSYMAKEKPYLDPEFSVYSLAEAIQLPRRLLSQVLNSSLSKNFYQYVNEYRIEEVKQLLVNPNEKKTTILDLAFQSGFKSKSSFNSLFKQYCDVTPSQYRKVMKNNITVD